MQPLSPDKVRFSHILAHWHQVPQPGQVGFCNLELVVSDLHCTAFGLEFCMLDLDTETQNT